MRTLILAFSLGIALVAIFLPSCRHELVLPLDGSGPQDTIPLPPIDSADYSGTPCSPDTVYFQNQILPILVSQCAKSGCHDVQSHKEGVIMVDYQRIISTGKVKAYYPNSSKLYTVLSISNPEDRMPPAPDSPLSTEQKNLIKKWIEQGALNNECNENFGGCDTTNVTYTNFVGPLMANSCTGCHGVNNPSGGIRLTSYAETKTSAQSGRLYGSIAHQAGYKAMPDGAPALSTCFINKVHAWISAGMPQ